MCGKNQRLSAISSSSSGSPPRVREKLTQSVSLMVFHRITPACAGKTFDVDHTLRNIQDHPRVCGKNYLQFKRMNRTTGSPPRVREKRIWNGNQFWYAGITPACAGKTMLSQHFQLNQQDHPRVCGKNLVALISTIFLMGSPPRVREKLFDNHMKFCVFRITPACAGKTLKGPNEIKTFLSF